MLRLLLPILALAFAALPAAAQAPCPCGSSCKCADFGKCPGCCPAVPLSYADGYAAALKGESVTLFVDTPARKGVAGRLANSTAAASRLAAGEYVLTRDPLGRGVAVYPMNVVPRPAVQAAPFSTPFRSFDPSCLTGR